MGQYRQITKTLSIAAAATERLWDAPSSMPFRNVSISVKSTQPVLVDDLTYQVFLGGRWNGTPFASASTHIGGQSQGAAASMTVVTGAITQYADAGDATHVIVTSAGHGLSDGDTVTITGSTNYNGTFVVSSSATNTFEIVDTWVVDDAAGTWTFHGDVAELIFEDASTHPGNSPSSPSTHHTGGYPVVVEFVNSTANDLELLVTFVSETVGTNV